MNIQCATCKSPFQPQPTCDCTPMPELVMPSGVIVEIVEYDYDAQAETLRISAAVDGGVATRTFTLEELRETP